MEQNRNAPKKWGTFFKNLFLNNIVIKVSALLFAMVLWGVVLTTQNPPRIKSISDVPVLFTGTADLQANGLIVRGDPLAELGGATVRVSTPVTTYRDITAEQIVLRVDLSTVQAKGTYEMEISDNLRSYYSDTKIESVSPEKVTVEIDTLVTQTVPLQVFDEIGELPEGYWAGEPVLEVDGAVTDRVTISGPEQDVVRVKRAVCYVDMNITETFNQSEKIVLLDEDNNEIDTTSFLEVPNSANVKIAVSPKKTVTIDAEGSLTGTSNLPSNYEFHGATTTPATFEIRGTQEKLDETNTLLFKSYNVSELRDGFVLEDRQLIIPDGITVIGYEENADVLVDVYIDIREKVIERDFDSIQIGTEGLERGLKATLSRDTTDVTISGRISIVDLLERRDVMAYVDLTGRGVGDHDVEVEIYLGDDDTTLEADIISSVQQIRVTISEK